jgi:hypothetical protein
MLIVIPIGAFFNKNNRRFPEEYFDQAHGSSHQI